MSEEIDVLKQVTAILEKMNVPYIISGSIAANYYSIPRMTRDIDIVIELKRPVLKNFVEKFKREFFLDEDVIQREMENLGMFNLIHREYVIKIDFILHKQSAFQKSTFLRRKKIIIEDHPMCLISLEDIVLSKLLWSKESLSEMQLNDVRNLIKTNPRLDKIYLEDWIKKLGLEENFKLVK